MRSHGLDRALGVIGDRWSLQIVAQLLEGAMRYNELADALGPNHGAGGIAPNVLSSRLRHLESARLVEGEPYQERPRRLRYALTADGRALGATLGALEAWGTRGDSPTNTHQACGTPLEWRPWCPTCELPIDDANASGTWV